MRRLIVLSFALLAGCALAPLGPSTRPAVSAAAEHGMALASRDCAACHVIGTGQPGSSTAAPPFATIRLRHNALSLERLLGDIARDGHFEMPRRPLSSGDIQDLVAFIESQPDRPFGPALPRP